MNSNSGSSVSFSNIGATTSGTNNTVSAAEAARIAREIERAREEAAKQKAIREGTYKSVWEGVETVYGQTW